MYLYFKIKHVSRSALIFAIYIHILCILCNLNSDRSGLDLLLRKWYLKPYFFTCDMFMVVVIAEGKVHQSYCQAKKGLGSQKDWHVLKHISGRSVIPVSLRYKCVWYNILFILPFLSKMHSSNPSPYYWKRSIKCWEQQKYFILETKLAAFIR